MRDGEEANSRSSGAAFELADAQSQAGASGRDRPRWGLPAQGSVGREERCPACAGLGEARDTCSSPGRFPPGPAPR